jgi:hypothetical protein
VQVDNDPRRTRKRKSQDATGPNRTTVIGQQQVRFRLEPKSNSGGFTGTKRKWEAPARNHCNHSHGAFLGERGNVGSVRVAAYEPGRGNLVKYLTRSPQFDALSIVAQH